MNNEQGVTQSEIDSFASKYMEWAASLPERERAMAIAIVEAGIRALDEGEVSGFADAAASNAQAEAVKKILTAVNDIIANKNKQMAEIQGTIRS